MSDRELQMRPGGRGWREEVWERRGRGCTGVGGKRALTADWRCAGLEEQGALVAEAHRREKTRAATVRQGAGLKD